MSTDHKHTGTYTAADIERYLNGQMTAAEKHALEKAALEDPFLAEAMEGYAGIPDLPLQPDIQGLKQRLQERNAGNKVIPVRKYRIWWSAAAAVLLVAGTATTWYLFNQSPEHGVAQTAAEIHAPAPQSAAVPDSAVAVRSEGKGAQKKSNATEQEEKKKIITKPGRNDTGIDTVSILPDDKAVEIAPAPQPATAKQRAGNLLQNEVEAEAKDIASDKQDIARSAAQAPAIQREKTDAYLSSHIFKGRITDSNDKPLPFVNITAGSIHTYTDAQGNFTILSGDSVVNASVRSVGYEPKNAMLASNTPLNNIKLSPGINGVSEVVVTGYGIKKKKELRKQAEIQDKTAAEPVDGWGNYDIYLSNNKRLPSEKNKAAGGFVEVAFTVNKAGALYDFKIEQSTCSTCNNEAVRLIREGPKWRLTAGDQPGKVSVTIQF